MSKWYHSNGNNSDVVMYSCVCLHRNLADTSFPIRMSNELRKSVNKKIYATIKSSAMANEFDLINLADVSDIDAVSYYEKKLISSAFAKNKENSSFMLSKDENVSIMLCEEDHIVIRSFSEGQDLTKAYSVANDIDDAFINGLKIAFDQKLGFLTSSPMNLGTGLRASYALHLPALAHKDSIYKLSSMVGKLGLSLREMYKDGAGDIYELSNQVTLGISEKNAIDNLTAICDQIIKQERSAREDLKQDSDLEDKIYRTLGMFKMARKISSKEMLNGLSLIRLGISQGYFDIEYSVIGKMIYSLQDASLVSSSKATLTESVCEKLRAKLIREDFE